LESAKRALPYPTWRRCGCGWRRDSSSNSRLSPRTTKSKPRQTAGAPRCPAHQRGSSDRVSQQCLELALVRHSKSRSIPFASARVLRGKYSARLALGRGARRSSAFCFLGGLASGGGFSAGAQTGPGKDALEFAILRIAHAIGRGFELAAGDCGPFPCRPDQSLAELAHLSLRSRVADAVRYSRA